MSNNPNLTSVKFPTTNNRIIDLDCHSTGLTGTVDISGLTDLDGQVDFSFDSSLTQVLFPPSSGSITLVNMNSCDITGTMDVSGLTISGGFYTNNNHNLTDILFPSSGTFTYFQLIDCSLKTLDLSNFTLSGPNINFNGNPELSSITWPASLSGAYTQFIIDDCSLNQTTVDEMFSLLNDYFTINPPTNSGLFSSDGGTNSPPTDGLNNVDISSLQYIYSQAGQSLTIQINT